MLPENLTTTLLHSCLLYVCASSLAAPDIVDCHLIPILLRWDRNTYTLCLTGVQNNKCKTPFHIR